MKLDMKPSAQSRILTIGADTALAYLIGRYAEQGGYDSTMVRTVPSATEVLALQPAAILFLSIEDLGSAQLLITDLVSYELPVLVCLSNHDEARARELGADHCLLHPLTYDGFVAALAATKADIR
jgi:DNA-binding response OmpR family regulator